MYEITAGDRLANLHAVYTSLYHVQVSNRPAWCAGVMFLTNVFFVPFMALRAAPEKEPAG